MFVEPERRDLSSIPPQPTRCPKALSLKGVVGLQLPIKSGRLTRLGPPGRAPAVSSNLPGEAYSASAKCKITKRSHQVYEK